MAAIVPKLHHGQYENRRIAETNDVTLPVIGEPGHSR